MTCLLAAIFGGIIASVLYELVFPPVRRPPALSSDERRKRADGRDRGLLNDGTVPTTPGTTSSKLVVGPEHNDGGGS